MLLLGWCIVPLVAVAQDPKSDAVKEEMKKLEGTWVVVSSSANGKENKETGVRQWVFNGDQVSLPFRGEQATTSYRVDPSQTPKALTIQTPKTDSETIIGDAIYELSGDTLRVCFGPPGSRPKEFSDKDQRLILILKRKK
jgi:uncharacterized protein (TIGR03067 family)